MMDVLQRSLTTFVSLLGMRWEVSTSGGITLKLHSFLGGGGVVVVVVVVVVELVSSPPPAEVSLAARFFLRGANCGQVYTYTGASRISETRNSVNSVSEKKIQQTRMKQKMSILFALLKN